MLDDLSIAIESKDVYASPICMPGPLLVAMQNDEVILSQHPPELNALAGILSGHAFEILNERILAVSDHWIVLSVAGTDVSAHSFGRFALIEHQVVEGHDS